MSFLCDVVSLGGLVRSNNYQYHLYGDINTAAVIFVDTRL